MGSSSNDNDEYITQITPQATRSRTGCLTCRARKVRCDRSDFEAGQSCGRCARLGVQCVSSNNNSLSKQEREQLGGAAGKRHELNQAGFTRLRAAASCRHCRSRRQKCSGGKPSCTRCLQSNQQCIYDRGKNAAAAAAASRRGEPKQDSKSPVVPLAPAPARNSRPVGEATIPAAVMLTSKSLGNLQDKTIIRGLVETFFHEVSPLRVFGFIHEPSFMLHMDRLLSNEDKDPLLLTVCALATSTINQEPHIRSQGAQWAQTAVTMVYSQAHRISVNVLMCLVLLHEFFSRIDELKQCFVLSGIAARICQALQLNVEYDEDLECRSSPLSPTEKETRRRLMWACYCMDFNNSGGGLDCLKMFREEDMKIQMPSDEESFFYRTAEITSVIRPVGQLGQQDHPSVNLVGLHNAVLGGYRAYWMHLTIFRERVLRYLKRRDQEENPSRPGSEFNGLVSDLEQWKASLPQNLQLTPEIIYIRKSQGVLSALFDLHTSYHQCGCDLYRAMVPELQLPPRHQSNMTLSATPEYLAEGKRKWFEHACDMTQILRLAMIHAPKSMTEANIASNAYTAIRTKLYYVLYIMTDQERQAQVESVEELINSDLEFIRQINKLLPSTTRTLACSEELVRTLDPRSGGTRPAEEAPEADAQSVVKPSPHSSHEGSSAVPDTINVDLTASTPRSQAGSTCPPRVPGFNEAPARRPRELQRSADSILHPLSVFRLIRNQIPEKHIPEKMRSSNPFLGSDDGVSPGLDLSLPFLTAPPDMPQQQQFPNVFWDIDENSFAWVNAPVQEHDFGMADGWMT